MQITLLDLTKNEMLTVPGSDIQDEVCTREVVRIYRPVPKGLYILVGETSRLVLRHVNCPIHRVEEWGSFDRPRGIYDGIHDA